MTSPVRPPARPNGLYTDLYELRMVESYLRRGLDGEATFSLYIRPTVERPWFVALGVERVLAFLTDFRYGPDELTYLRGMGVDGATIDWLATFEPAGELWAVDDGTIVLADEPIIEVTGPLPSVQLIETAVINIVQQSTLVATKAARMAIAAAGRPLVDFGFRRAQGLESGVEASRAAYVAGVTATSNLEAGRRFGIPVVGTMAHSFVLTFSSELDAFRAFAEDHPADCVLLVDTYDTIDGVRNAITVAREMQERGARLRGVRLDSGDLAALSERTRAMLDDAGLRDVTIFASGGLDENDIARLVAGGAPIDAFGVGTDLVVSMDRPALDIAYKLVSYDGRDVAKHSPGKATLPGAKQVFRRTGPVTDVLTLRTERLDGEPLLRPVWRDGSALTSFDLDTSRTRVAEQLASLPDDWRRISARSEPFAPRLSDALRDLAGRS